MNINFLSILINSYEMLGRNDEAEIILDEIFEKNENDKSILEFIFNFYEEKNSEKAGIVINKLYSIDKTLINRIRKNYFIYENSDYIIFDNLSQVDFDGQEVQEILNTLKDNQLLLKNAIVENKTDIKLHEYNYKISKSLIDRNELRISENEYIFYWLSGIKSIIQLIKLDNKNPLNYLRYSDFISESYISRNEMKDNAEVSKILKKNIGKIDEKSIKFFSDSIIKISYDINKGRYDKIIVKYFQNITNKENKSKYHLSNDEAQALIDKHIELKPNSKVLLDLKEISIIRLENTS